MASGGCLHLLLWFLSLSHSTKSSCQSQARSTSSPLYRPVIPTEPAGTSPSAGLGCWAFAFCHPPFCHFCATVPTHHKARVVFEVVSFHECQTGSRRQVPSSLPELSPASPSMLTPTHTYRVLQALGPSSKSVLHPSPGQEGFPCLPLNQGTYLAFYPHRHACGLVFKPGHHEAWTD